MEVSLRHLNSPSVAYTGRSRRLRGGCLERRFKCSMEKYRKDGSSCSVNRRCDVFIVDGI